MTALLLLPVLIAPDLSIDEQIKRADALAAAARDAEGPAKKSAVAHALKVYAAIIERRPKDRKLVPRILRRRASLLKHAGRPQDAIAEYDRIIAGRARRKDKAKALYDSAMILRREADLPAAEERLGEALHRYRDISSVRAKSLLARGDICLETDRPDHARAAWREVIERCEDEEKEAIAAFDRLALHALDEGDPRRARRWLEKCVAIYGKRAAKRDRFAGYLSRLLGEMRAPVRLAEAERRKKAKRP